jgi:hypothetical protein
MRLSIFVDAFCSLDVVQLVSFTDWRGWSRRVGIASSMRHCVVVVVVVVVSEGLMPMMNASTFCAV